MVYSLKRRVALNRLARASMVGLGSTDVRHVPQGEVHAGNPAKLLRRAN